MTKLSKICKNYPKLAYKKFLLPKPWNSCFSALKPFSTLANSMPLSAARIPALHSLPHPILMKYFHHFFHLPSTRHDPQRCRCIFHTSWKKKVRCVFKWIANASAWADVSLPHASLYLSSSNKEVRESFHHPHHNWASFNNSRSCILLASCSIVSPRL